MRTKITMLAQQIEAGNFHLFIPVKIGRKSARMLLDTGASKSVMDEERVFQFIKKHSLKIDAAQSVGLGAKTLPTNIAELPSVNIAEAKLVGVEVAVLNLNHVNEIYRSIGLPEIDGVLGSDLLMKYKAIINYEKRLLSLII